jgi:hypothetical protein
MAGSESVKGQALAAPIIEIDHPEIVLATLLALAPTAFHVGRMGTARSYYTSVDRPDFKVVLGNDIVITDVFSGFDQRGANDQGDTQNQVRPESTHC